MDGEMELRLEPIDDSTSRLVAEGPTDAVVFCFSVLLGVMAGEVPALEEGVSDVSPS